DVPHSAADELADPPQAKAQAGTLAALAGEVQVEYSLPYLRGNAGAVVFDREVEETAAQLLVDNGAGRNYEPSAVRHRVDGVLDKVLDHDIEIEQRELGDVLTQLQDHIYAARVDLPERALHALVDVDVTALFAELMDHFARHLERALCQPPESFQRLTEEVALQVARGEHLLQFHDPHSHRAHGVVELVHDVTRLVPHRDQQFVGGAQLQCLGDVRTQLGESQQGLDPLREALQHDLIKTGERILLRAFHVQHANGQIVLAEQDRHGYLAAVRPARQLVIGFLRDIA